MNGRGSVGRGTGSQENEGKEVAEKKEGTGRMKKKHFFCDRKKCGGTVRVATQWGSAGRNTMPLLRGRRG